MIGSRTASTSVLLRALERALLALAIVLLGWYAFQQLSTSYYQAVSNRELEAIRIPVTAAPVTRNRAPLARGSLVGRVDVPRVGVSSIIREGDDTATLRHSVGHIPETALPGEPGNAGLAGHRDSFFRGLKDVRTGDRIVVTTPDSVVHYVIRGTRIVGPDDVSVLGPTPRQTLTLVTCYPFNYIGAAPMRFIVQADMADDRRQ
jgi:sortase A